MATTLTPPGPARTDDTGSSNSPPPRFPVAVALVSTFLIFAACASWLIYRGATIDVPDTMFVVRGSPAWEGAEAVVDGIKLARAQRATINREGRYTISFHLTPGDYRLDVRHDGRTVYSSDFRLTRQGRIGFAHLPPTPIGLTPASQPTQPRLEFRSPWAQ